MPMLPELANTSPQQGIEGPDTLRHRIEFLTGGNAVRHALVGLKEVIDGYPHLTDDMRHSSELVLAEAVNNIAEHSYQGRADQKIYVELLLQPHHIEIATKDFGRKMPGLTLPEKSLPSSDVPVHDLPEGGFGWYLIHVLAPNPRYMRVEDANLLKFVLKRLEAHPT